MASSVTRWLKEKTDHISKTVADTGSTLTLLEIGLYDRIVADTSGGAFNLTLPAVGASDDGIIAKFTCQGANAFTINGNGGDTVGGAASNVIVDEESLVLEYNHANTNWLIV